jgi:uncharacterized coiled-coil DUF342 family protein
MNELAALRRERDRLERRIDQLHAKHDAAQRTARHCCNEVVAAEGDLNEVLLRIKRLAP